VAPVSWIIQRHVEEGRAVLNFSEWDRPQEGMREAAEVIAEGEMPPGYYRLLRKEASLSVAEAAALAQTLGSLRSLLVSEVRIEGLRSTCSRDLGASRDNVS
jgi:hypothetical protein